MSEEKLDRIFEKLDGIKDDLAGVKGQVAVLSFRVESYAKPCPDLKQLMLRHDEDDKEIADIRKQTKAWLIISVIGLIGAAVLFAIKNGWKP